MADTRENDRSGDVLTALMDLVRVEATRQGKLALVVGLVRGKPGKWRAAAGGLA